MTAPAVDQLPDLFGTAPADLAAADPREVTADLTTARQRAERIRTDLVTYSRMRQDIADAYAQRDWAALDYGSWYAYLQGEFGQELQQLARSREERQLAVGDLRGQGLSTRQIAAVAGVDAKTVRNDLADQPTAAPTDKVVGSDGKSYPAVRHVSSERSEWEAVFQALGECADAYGIGGWATAKAVAERLGLGWSASIVTRRLNALREGGRVEQSTDQTVTGVRGVAWRPRQDPPRAAAIETVELPADDVQPDPQTRPVGSAGSAHDPRAEPVSGAGTPRADRALNLPADRDLQESVAVPGEGTEAVATTGQPGSPHPIVLVSSAVPGQRPARAEVWEDDGKNTVVKVVYCDSRTGAWVARKRILGPAEPEAAHGALRIAGSDELEVFDHGVIRVGDRDLRLLAGRVDGDVPVAFLSVQHGDQETELLALNALKVQLLIQKLTAIHGWLVGEQLPDDE